MFRNHRRTLVAGAVALTVATGAGAAIAASLDPRAESQAVLSGAAERLGVTPRQLSEALRESMKERLDAAVAAGRLTQEHADRMKERLDAGGLPLVGPGPGLRHHRLGGPVGLEAAASYLGLTEQELRAALRDGRSLADVARSEGMAVDGLLDALVAAAEKRLDEAVAAGRLTDARRDEVAATLEERVRAFVESQVHPRLRGRVHGPPPFDAAA